MNDFNGDIRFMPENILTKNIESLYRQLEEHKEERKRRNAFTPIEILADRLHDLLHLNADCDYNYSHWPKPQGCRAVFKTKAQTLNNWVAIITNTSYDSTVMMHKFLDSLEEMKQSR
jgi:hypothetical protein